jgi:hypothetical protein
VDWNHLRWLILYLLPAIPLFFAWRSSIPGFRSTAVWKLFPQIIATVSLLWIAAMFVNEGALGPEYSDLRGGILLGNAIFILASCLFSFIAAIFPGQRKRHLMTGLACILLLVDWVLTAAANSVA